MIFNFAGLTVEVSQHAYALFTLISMWAPAVHNYTRYVRYTNLRGRGGGGETAMKEEKIPPLALCRKIPEITGILRSYEQYSRIYNTVPEM